jgi:hypothetical protein
MGKGRDKRRRDAKRTARMRATKAEPLGGEPLGPVDPYAHVLAPLKPKPSPRSGAIALPEPDDESFFAEIQKTYG